MADQLNKQHARLIVETGENQGLNFPLRESIISIGRGPDNSIQIIDAHMSRDHSLLIFSEGGWSARDLGSKNGTQVNDLFINGDYRLRHGDRLLIGNTTFLFEQASQTLEETTDSATGVRVTSDAEAVEPSQVYKLYEELGNDAEITNIFSSVSGEGQRLALLYRISEMISTILDLDELLERVMDLVQRYLKPDRAGILLYDQRYRVLLPKVTRRPDDSRDEIVISHSIIDRAIDEQAALLVSDTFNNGRIKTSDSMVKNNIHSAICVPFIHRNEVLGVLYLDRRHSTPHFGEHDLRLVAGIANQAALAIANARLHQKLLQQHGKERELEIARTIQQNLLPQTMPRLPDFEIAGISQPALMVGGDYYDVISLPDGRTLLAIADVSGKGVPAAILISAVRAAVQIEVRNMHHDGLVEIVNRLNQMVCRDTSGAMFVTMILAILDPIERTLSYCNAGHVHPILCSPDGELETLDAGGCFLGIMPGLAYEKGVVTLEAGSLLVMYSDGVTDMMNEEQDMFGIQKLTDSLMTLRKLPAEEILTHLTAQAEAFRGEAEPFDDLTLLILKATEPK